MARWLQACNSSQPHGRLGYEPHGLTPCSILVHVEGSINDGHRKAVTPSLPSVACGLPYRTGPCRARDFPPEELPTFPRPVSTPCTGLYLHIPVALNAANPTTMCMDGHFPAACEGVPGKRTREHGATTQHGGPRALTHVARATRVAAYLGCVSQPGLNVSRSNVCCNAARCPAVHRAQTRSALLLSLPHGSPAPALGRHESNPMAMYGLAPRAPRRRCQPKPASQRKLLTTALTPTTATSAALRAVVPPHASTQPPEQQFMYMHQGPAPRWLASSSPGGPGKAWSPR